MSKKKKITLQNLIDVASMNGGKCLTEEFENVKTKYMWSCKKGHIWEASFNNVAYNNTWCPVCNKKQKLSIEDMHELAAKRNGKCLSKNYINRSTKLTWECEQGHIWEATPDNIKNRNSWCKQCYQTVYSIDFFYDYARNKGGQCLSTHYVNNSTALKFKCARGHVWETKPRNIQKAYWCPVCGNQIPKDLEHLQEIAKSHNGKLISTKYINMQSNYLWKCDKGHEFKAPAAAVKVGRWCHQCRKIPLEKIQKIAEEKGGKCLSTKVINGQTPLDFECKEGHIFQLNPTNVINKDSWCTVCSFSIWEEKTRHVLETLLGKRFIKTRQIIGKQLELDGYNEDDPTCKIAFEFNGPQHYHFIPYFHGDLDGFKKQQSDDKEKVEVCKKEKINLIVVSYVVQDILVEYIKGELTAMNIPFENIDVDLNSIYKSKSKIEGFKSFVESKGGTLLSEGYNDYYTKLKIRCSNNHVFEIRPYPLLKNNRWCKECKKAENLIHQYEKLKSLCHEHGVKVLSSNYVTNSSHMDFQCSDGHIWTSTPQRLKKGYWCPHDRCKLI